MTAADRPSPDGERVASLIAEGWFLLPNDDWWEKHGPNYVEARQRALPGDREAWAAADRGAPVPQTERGTMTEGLPDRPEWCELCNNAPPTTDDIFCGPCRQHVTDVSDQITDPLELVLSAHMPMEPLSSNDSTMCRCGERFDSGPAVHRRHLAQMIYQTLGLPGPSGWILGLESAMREHPLADWLTKDIATSAGAGHE